MWHEEINCTMLKTIQIYAEVYANAIFLIALVVIRSVQSFFGYEISEFVPGIPKGRLFTVRLKNFDSAILLFYSKYFGEASSNKIFY